MSDQSREERERLKEEYKDHYRRMKDAAEGARRSRYVNNINEALGNMNSDELLGSVDEFLGKVRDKVSGFEARLEVALDSLEMGDAKDKMDAAELEKEMAKENARETLRKMKMEMGLLYSELEEQAKAMNVNKTVGPDKPEIKNDEDQQ
jgi:hypothetical protein